MSHVLLQSSGTQTTRLDWQSPIPTWVWILVIVPAVLAFAVFVYRREWASREGGRPRGVLPRVLVGLRVAIVIAVAALLAQPVWRTTKYQDADSTVILLADGSLSMDIADKYSDRNLVQGIADFFRSTPDSIEAAKRYDLVRRLFVDDGIGFLEKLRKKLRIAVYTFGSGVQKQKEVPRRKEGDADLTPEEREVLPEYAKLRGEERSRETRIADSILDAVSSERSAAKSPESRIAGVVVLSDGQQTPGSRPIEDVARRLGGQRIPIHTVGVGNPDEPKDIRVLSLDVSDVVLAGDLVPFDAAIVADGFQGERVRVDLKLDGEVVKTDYVVLEGQGRRQPVRLEYRPPKPGDFVVTVEVEHKSGELFSENNASSRPIKVLDQKIKVLYAEGPPRWHYRYMKNALIRDPTMQAQVFLFSADPTFVQESSNGVPSLTEFPKTREEIFSYHVIILGDVDIARRLSNEQVALLRDFVYEAGGGIVFIAGETANPSKYLHTELYNILPVEVPDRGDIEGGFEKAPKTSPFNVELMQVGREHSVLRLENDFDRNVKLWENRDGQLLEHLPPFVSFQEVGRSKKGAVVLARHPNRLQPLEQKGLVVFAFMNYGKGRTFFSAVDDTWRWRAGVENQYFYRFWGQVVRFCATGRLVGKTPRYAITTDKVSYTLGENVNTECRVYDADMKPSTDKRLTIYHAARSGEGTAPESIELELDPIQGQGAYHGGLVANRLGVHDVWIGTETERFAFRQYEVVVPALEFRDPRRNRAVLGDLARLSGGLSVEIQDISKVSDRLESESRVLLGDVEDDPLWDDLWLILTLTGILALEWILRKVAHLL